jgi:hypothetical protein
MFSGRVQKRLRNLPLNEEIAMGELVLIFARIFANACAPAN